MTRVLVILDAGMIAWIEQALPAAELARLVQSGKWLPPPPLDGCIPPHAALQAHQVQETLVVFPAPTPEQAAAHPLHLSPRQRQVVQAMIQGCTIKEIAHQMGISPRTVTYHLQEIKTRLGCRSRAELVRQAVLSGLCAPASYSSRQC